MPALLRARNRYGVGTAAIFAVVAGVFSVVLADEARLRNGMLIDGAAFPAKGITDRTTSINADRTNPSEAYWVVDDGVRYYFLPTKSTKVQQKDELSSVPEFKLERTLKGRGASPDVIGTSVVTPFDKAGMRTVTLRVRKKPANAQRNGAGLSVSEPLSIVEAITAIRPDYLKLEGISHHWKHGLDTRLLPSQTLSDLLHNAVHMDRLNDRKQIVLFYIDAEMYEQAHEELEHIASDFPAEKTWVEAQLPVVAEQQFRAGMREVLRRQQAGQHALAELIASKAPPEKVSVEVLRQAEEIVAYYKSARELRDRAFALLEEYEAKIEADDAASLKPFRLAIRDEVHFENVDRLKPFVDAESDDTLTAEQKLAMAYSAWAVGPSFADVDLKLAINLWKARNLILEFLRFPDDAVRREEMVSRMAELEGVTVERVSQIVPLLPYVLEEMPPAPGELRDYSVSDATVTANYSVVLPLEYHSQHRYPLLVILRRSQQSTTDAIRMWAGNANEPGYTMRRGYIAISPEYMDGKAANYEYSAAGHRQVMAAIDDVRKKFAVDSDRIFIVGHELGGDAAIDIALGHPDVFAGAAPFLPQPQGYAIRTWESALLLPWYFVGGQRDRDSVTHIANFVDRLSGKRASDFVYCEYKARGEEIYSEEFNRLFDWMQTYRRRTLAEVKGDWRMEVMRPTDDRCFWIVSGGLPAKLSEPIVWDKPKTIPAAMEMRSKITMGNEMYVWHPGSHLQIWLSPEMIDFGKRFRVESKGRRFNDFVRPSIATMLEDFQLRGDRERLYWAKVEL